MFAFAVHVLINNKFAGHALGMMIFVAMLLVSSTGRFDYRLLLYSYTPDYWITDMDGLGPSVAPQLWFTVYWILAGCILVLIGAMFYYRGMLANFSERIKLAADRFKGAPVKIAVLLLIGFFSTGFYNYYNVSYLNEWLTRRELAERQVAYEKQLKKYSVLPLPKLKKVRLYIDIFPVERKIISRAVVTIINSDPRPINKILLEYDHVTTYSVLYNGRQIPFTQPLIYPWPKFTFFKRGMDTSMNRLYELSTPLMPGDTAVMEVFSALSAEGFTNNYSALAVQHNATAFNDYLPELGYDEGDEMKLYSKRKEYGLPPRPDDKLPDAGDSAGIRRLFFTPFSSLIDFEATVSTSSDQFAIAPGILDSTWKDKNRNYFHYTMNDPKTYEPFPIFSAKYSVIHDSVTLANGKTVCIEIDYHKTHTANLDRFLEATKEGLTYFSRAFGNYPFHEMRVIEGPGFIRAGDFPNIIAYPENYAWNASFTNPGELDYCYFVTAMHLGRQWWRFQVAPNNTQGSQVISSGLSKYGALMLYEKRYGQNNMKELLNSENRWYLFSHRFIFEKENPLLNASKEYVWDTKAGIIFYALQDLMGEDSLNAALREFYNAYSYRNQPPYAGSDDLLKVLKNRVPDSLQYFLSDGFERITLYDNKMLKATVSPFGNNNEFKVHLEIVVRKVYADTSGKEADAALMNDYIDIGIFTNESKDKNGRTIASPLYLMKHKLSAGKHVIDVIVKGKPVRAGIDPYNKLIDKNLADNTISISN
jgi:ABC-2 type transport system permease protein